MYQFIIGDQKVMPKRPERMEKLLPYGLNTNKSVNLVGARLGDTSIKIPQPDSVDGSLNMAKRLMSAGGFAQQQRMIKDKRHSLDQATKYSYQAAWVRKCAATEVETKEEKNILPPVRALINPNKLKQDYDDKIISIGFEHKFNCGDVFEWCNTGTYWLIYLQDLEELAYFRGDIRRCTYEIPFMVDDQLYTTYAAIRGPVETKIDYIQKHQISIDNPNYSLNLLVPKNEKTLAFFKRYQKFYIWTSDGQMDETCWRVEAVNSISMIGVIEVNAVEYYANEFNDDKESGIADAFKGPDPLIKQAIIDKNKENNKIFSIVGETFIKPKKEYDFNLNIKNIRGTWKIEGNDVPVRIISEGTNDKGFATIKLKWDSTYSGQFDLVYGTSRKTIVVESLF